jgi:hypothetical protein
MTDPNKARFSDLWCASVLGAIYATLFDILVLHPPIPLVLTRIPSVDQTLEGILGLTLFVSLTLLTVKTSVKLLRRLYRWAMGTTRWRPFRIIWAEED